MPEDELIAIPVSEYNYLLQCKQELENIYIERITRRIAEIDELIMDTEAQRVIAAIQTGCQTIVKERSKK